MRAKPAIYLQKTKIAKGRISFDYSVSEDLRKYFCDEQEFFVEYHEDMECVPTAVAAVIFIANVLPLVWLTDADLYLPELDTTFLDSIDELRQGYEQLFPGVAFAGRVIVDRRVDCNYLPSENRALFFSGGVDSTFSLFEHLNERPHLISLWGADLALENLRGWQEVQGQVEAIARDLNLKKAFVKTSFRKVLNTKELNKEFNERLESNWWLWGYSTELQ